MSFVNYFCTKDMFFRQTIFILIKDGKISDRLYMVVCMDYCIFL